nr:hypothetical protein [Bacteroidota bacterium]
MKEVIGRGGQGEPNMMPVKKFQVGRFAGFRFEGLEVSGWNEKQTGSVRLRWVFQRWPDLRVGGGDG